MMIQKKICMIGDFAVGKTSLVRRFVKSMFEDKYLTTVGVKIDKKVVQLGAVEVMLVLWDIEGQDIYNTLKTSYLRGASGYFLVADGTRNETLSHVGILRERVQEAVGDVPYLVLLNKSDLTEAWEIAAADLQHWRDSGITVVETSAKTGLGVETAFLTLARRLLERPAEENPILSKGTP